MKHYLSILICFLLFCCKDPTNGDDTIENLNRPETNVQIYNKTDGSLYLGTGVVNATIYQWGGTTWTIQAGTISNGKLGFNFPSIIPQEKLEPFWGTLDHPNAFITPESAKYCGTISTFRYPFIVYNSIGEKLGELTFGKINQGNSDYIGDTVYYFYFDQNVKISGFLIISSHHTENYQINAKKGWNRIYVHETSNNGNILTIYSSDPNIIPNNFKWEFIE
jgi:hypothetical protein